MSEAYSFEIMRRVVAGILVDQGIMTAEPAAVDCLAEIAGRYIEAIGRQSKSHAELSGRSESNLLDVLGALKTVNNVQLEKLLTVPEATPFGREIQPYPKKSINCVTTSSYDEYLRTQVHTLASGRARELFTPANLLPARPPFVPIHSPPNPPEFAYRYSKAEVSRAVEDKVLIGKHAENKSAMQDNLGRLTYLTASMEQEVDDLFEAKQYE